MSARATIRVEAVLRLPVSKMIADPPTASGTSETRRIVAWREATVTLEVDAGSLLRLLGTKAAGYKSRRSIEAGGDVRVTAHYVSEPVPCPEPFPTGGPWSTEVVRIDKVETVR